MAYTRRSPKRDIRALPRVSLRASTPPLAKPTDENLNPRQSESLTMHYNPWIDLRRIILITLPLLVVLGIATYYDSQYGWVLALAKKTLALGS